MRLSAKNQAGEGCLSVSQLTACEFVSTGTEGQRRFETEGSPSVGTFAVNALQGESLRLSVRSIPIMVAHER